MLCYTYRSQWCYWRQYYGISKEKIKLWIQRKREREKKEVLFIIMAANTYKNGESIHTVVLHSLMMTICIGIKKNIAKNIKNWINLNAINNGHFATVIFILRRHTDTTSWFFIMPFTIYHDCISIGRRTMALLTADSNVMRCKYEIRYGEKLFIQLVNIDANHKDWIPGIGSNCHCIKILIDFCFLFHFFGPIILHLVSVKRSK